MILSSNPAFAQVETDATTAGVLPPGVITGTGTHFEIVGSASYLDVTLDSSEPITVVLESTAHTFALALEPSSSAVSTELTLSRLQPSHAYFLYRDSHRDVSEFHSDSTGSYSFVQDLVEPHRLFIQTQPSTRFIPSDTSIGTWNAETRVFTLNTDLAETVEIEEGNMTLDGNGHTLRKPATAHYGVFLYPWSNVTITDLNIEGSGSGQCLYLGFGGNNVVMRNTMRNCSEGIQVAGSNGNVIRENTIEYNSNNGVSIRYRSSANQLLGNTIRHNGLGIWGWLNRLWGGAPHQNLIEGNDISSNFNGIGIAWGNGNIIRGNTVDSNEAYGISLCCSQHHVVSDNIVSNNGPGIRLIGFDSGAQTLWNNFSRNIVSNNTGPGLSLQGYSGWNTFYDNILDNDQNLLLPPSGSNTWNVDLVPGTNILGGDYLGGNYWSTPANTGFGDLCNDDDVNGICDSQYEISPNNVDYWPLAQELAIAPRWPAGSAIYPGSVGLEWVLLTWTPAVHDVGVAEYQVYQDGTLVGIVPGEVRSLEVAGLASGAEYLFKVEACANGALCSDDGPDVVARTLTPSQAIQELISEVISLNLNAGIENSIDAKLSNAQKALEDLTANNDIATINMLEAFVLEVEAQSGQHMEQVDADRLTAAAREIISVLAG
jgi:parallel beta-helix repeat protein